MSQEDPKVQIEDEKPTTAELRAEIEEEREANEIRLISQEHRLTHAARNYLEYRERRKGDPRRKAAFWALAWVFAFGRGVTIVAIGGGFLGTYLLWEQNQLAEKQNQLTREQNLYFQEQTKELREQNQLQLDEAQAARKVQLWETVFASERGCREATEDCPPRASPQARGEAVIALSNILRSEGIVRPDLSHAILRNAPINDEVPDVSLPEFYLTESSGMLRHSPLNATGTNLLMPQNPGEYWTERRKRYPKPRGLENAILIGADFSESRVKGVSFRNAVLLDADFSHSVVFGADFSFADLDRTNFAGSILLSIEGLSSSTLQKVFGDEDTHWARVSGELKRPCHWSSPENPISYEEWLQRLPNLEPCGKEDDPSENQGTAKGEADPRTD